MVAQPVTASDEQGMTSGLECYRDHARPRLVEMLRAVGLDVEYERAEGDTLYRTDERGEEIAVLDLVGGFGATLLGHNNPELVDRACALLSAGRPFHAQASIRGSAGTLAAELSDLVGRRTGRRYVCTLSNSGAEAVESAIKHAVLELRRRQTKVLEDLDLTVRRVKAGVRRGSVQLPAGLLSTAARELEIDEVASLDELDSELHRHIVNAFTAPPVFLAIERSFHGKTTAALQLTANREFRHPWRGISIRSSFIPAGDVEALTSIVADELIVFPSLHIEADGTVSLQQRSFANVAACFVEPIQGEGGIVELSSEFVSAIQATASEYEFPIVYDEIQTGMGRTGTLLASEVFEARGDYYLLGKSLGGSLAKIGALLVDAERYESEFSLLHTSTFAEDDFSSEIALSVLDMLCRDNERLIRDCERKGSYFLDRLRSLQSQYPDQLVAVRGRGLMIGVELKPQLDSRSALLRAISEQGLLAPVAAGYLLHREQVRVVHTLSAEGTIRIQPSALIELEQIDRACDALKSVLETIKNEDILSLTSHLVGRSRSTQLLRNVAPLPIRRAPQPTALTSANARRVAFLIHFFDPDHLREFDPLLGDLTTDECEALIKRTQRVVEPIRVKDLHIRSVTGDSVRGTLICLDMTARHIKSAFIRGDTDWILQKIDRGVEMARQEGCGLVGLGGYVSIVTRNGTALNPADVALTSGNSLTTVAAAEQLLEAGRQQGITDGCLGIVGAAGNIGAAIADILSDDIGSIVLFGRPTSRARLRQVAARLYAAAFERLLSEEEPRGLAHAIVNAAAVTSIPRSITTNVGRALYTAMDRQFGDRAPIRISTDLSALTECNLIVTATNAATPLIGAEHIGDGPVAVCDIAVPGDVSADVRRKKPNALVFNGGMVKLPCDQVVDLPGLRSVSMIHGCLAETLLLGLENLKEDFSYGALQPNRMRRIRRLAQKHGFILTEIPSGQTKQWVKRKCTDTSVRVAP